MMHPYTRLYRAPLLVVGAALLAAVATAAQLPGRTAGPPEIETTSPGEAQAVQQLAGGGPIPSIELPAFRLAGPTGARSTVAGPAPAVARDETGGPSSNVRVTTVDAFYDVVGTDRASIVGALRRQGPRDASGAWTGSLSWTFNWAYQPIRDGSGCRVNAASVDLRLTYTLPRLAAAVELSPVVRESWERFYSALRYHEDGHAALAIEAANGLVRDIEAAPPARTCWELRSAVESAVQASLARHEEAQVGYDQQTRHGVAQGATFSNRDGDPVGH